MLKKHQEETIALFDKFLAENRRLDMYFEGSDMASYHELKRFILSREQELVRKVVEEIQSIAETTTPNMLLNEIVNRLYTPNQ